MPKHFPSFDVNNWRRWKQIAERLLEENPITLTFDEIRHHMKPVSEVKLERGEIYFGLRNKPGLDELGINEGSIEDKVMKMVYLDDDGYGAVYNKVVWSVRVKNRWQIYGSPTHTSGKPFHLYMLIISWTDLLKIGKGEKFINWIDDNPFVVK